MGMRTWKGIWGLEDRRKIESVGGFEVIQNPK